MAHPKLSPNTSNRVGAQPFLGAVAVELRFVQSVDAGRRHRNEQNRGGIQSHCPLQKLDQTKHCQCVQVCAQQADESDQRSATR